jgi:hypothetical protein
MFFSSKKHCNAVMLFFKLHNKTISYLNSKTYKGITKPQSILNIKKTESKGYNSNKIKLKKTKKI